MAGKNGKRIADEKARWAQKFKTDRAPQVKTDLDIEVDALYTPADLTEADYLRDLGFPGEYPFTRGPYPEMSRRRPWRYSVFTGFDSPEETNARWKFLYQSGQPAFSIVYDLPTHLGLDSDDPKAEGEAGRVGLPLNTVEDFDLLFAGLPLGAAPFNSNMETLAAIVVAFYVATAQKRGIPIETLQGSISNDPLATAACKGTAVFPVESGVRLAADLIEYCTHHLPRFYPINLKGVNFSEGGANMAQEVGFSFANGMCYIEETLKRGLDIDAFAPKLSFFFSSTTHIFEEAAKYRAARRLWARLLKERFGAKEPASMALRFTGYACPLWMQFEEPELNLVRAALAALACALGGAQAMPHPGYDEAYAIPTEKSQSLALGTQQILAEETNITKAVDPLGGSYYIEYLTNQLEQKIAQKMKEIEDYGGPMKAINDGFMQRDVLDYFYRDQEAVRTGQRVVVRHNKYRREGEEEAGKKLSLHQPNPEAVERHITRLRRVRAERDSSKVQACLKRLQGAAAGKENMMPYLVEAAAACATLGEMTAALKEVFGTFKEPIVV